MTVRLLGPAPATAPAALRKTDLDTHIARTGFTNVKDYGAVGDGTTNDTAAVAAAYTAAAGQPLYFPTGTYLVTALPALADGDRLVGSGPMDAEILYTGTGTLMPLTARQDIAFRSMGFHLTGVGAKAFDLSGCFQLSFDDVRIRGEHTGATGSTYRTQVGILFRDNTGNTRVHNTIIANLGFGVDTSCIQNELTNSKIVNCYRSIRGVGGTANAGLLAVACEFIGDTDPDTCLAHVDITGTANTWAFSECWFEGSTTGLIIGVEGSGGPSSFTLTGCKIAARSVGIQFNSCRQPSLYGCEFNEDAGGTMTEIVFASGVVSTEVQEGICLNAVTTLRADFDDGDFPQYWNIMRKGSSRTPNLVVSSNATVAGDVTCSALVATFGDTTAGNILTSDGTGLAQWAVPSYPYDISMTVFAEETTRAAASSGDFTMGVKLPRSVTFTSVTYRVRTADASGNLVVELRKNGSAVAGSAATIAAANQVTGGTATGTWTFVAGDILTARITTVGTTPGKGLQVDITGTT